MASLSVLWKKWIRKNAGWGNVDLWISRPAGMWTAENIIPIVLWTGKIRAKM